MKGLDVIIKIQGEDMYLQYKDTWVPLNTKLIKGFGFSIRDIIVFKLIQLDALDEMYK